MLSRVAIKVVVLVLLLALFVGMAVPVALAGGVSQEGPTGIEEIDKALAAVGLGALVMIIVEILKRLKLIPDGMAGKIAVALGVFAYLVMLVLGIFGIDLAAPFPQKIIAGLTILAQLILTIIGAIGSYKTLRAGEVLKPMAGRV